MLPPETRKRPRWRNALKRLRGDARGAALVEFALVAPPFLLLLFGILEFGALGVMSATFNDAVTAASRELRTGQADKAQTAQAFAQHICAHMVSPSDCAGRIATSVRAWPNYSQLQSVAGTSAIDLTQANAFDSILPQSIVLVTATYRWPLIVPFAGPAFQHAPGSSTDVLIVSRAVFRAEPYPLTGGA